MAGLAPGASAPCKQFAAFAHCQRVVSTAGDLFHMKVSAIIMLL